MVDQPTTKVPHYYGHRQRLRERFLKSGFEGFAEHEIVELLLTLCIPYRDVKPAAKVLLGATHGFGGGNGRTELGAAN